MVRRLIRRTPTPSILFLALILVVGLAACGASGNGGGLYGSNNAAGSGSGSGSGNGNSNNASPTTTCANSTVLICTRSVTVDGASKNALVSRDGQTLYYFTSDTATTVACTSAGGCVTNWPPLMSSSATVAPISGLSGTLATVTRSQGNQITYNGHPLYNYAGDSAPGDTKGDGLFGKWFVATADLAPGGSDGNGYNSGY